jgi:hypothetical protein
MGGLGGDKCITACCMGEHTIHMPDVSGKFARSVLPYNFRVKPILPVASLCNMLSENGSESIFFSYAF